MTTNYNNSSSANSTRSDNADIMEPFQSSDSKFSLYSPGTLHCVSDPGLLMYNPSGVSLLFKICNIVAVAG